MNNKKKVLSAEEICSMFMEIAVKIEKCFDFEISHWLSKYEELRKAPNFPEAAMLIVSAAQIYGRKVDYLEEIILNMHTENKKQEKLSENDGQEECDQQPTKRKKAKRFRPEALCEKLYRAEFLTKKIKTVPLAKITEKLVHRDSAQSTRSMREELKTWVVNTSKNKQSRRRLRMEEEELFSRYTNFGKRYIYDYENDEVIGSRRDFKTFVGYIDNTSQAILNDINLRKHYKIQKQMEDEENEFMKEQERLQSLGLPIQNRENLKKPRFFKFYMSADYLKEKYDINIGENDFDCLSTMIEHEKSSSQSINDDITQNKKPVRLIPTTEKIIEKVPLTEDNPVVDSTSKLDVRISVDEGISEWENIYPKLSLPIRVSDLDEFDWEMLNPIVELVDIMLPFKDCIDVTKTKFEISRSLDNLLRIPESYLKHYEDFSLPIKFLEKSTPLILNILKLPESKLRKKCQFVLPKELEPIKIKASKIEPQPRAFKFELFKLNDNSYDRLSLPSSPQSVSNDFVGFDETEIDLSYSNLDTFQILSSTLRPSLINANSTFDESSLNLNQSDVNQSPNKSRTMSRDSGIQSPKHMYDQSDGKINMIDESVCDSGYGSSLKNTLPLDTITEEQETEQRMQLENNIFERLQNFENAIDEKEIEISDHHKELQRIASEQYQEKLDDTKAMTEKVNRWHEYLKPILKHSETRNHFDIHEYETDILNSFTANATKIITFADIMSNNDPEYTARYFLSMLQLANTKNIRIIAERNPTKVTELNNIQMKFLSDIRHHVEMENDPITSKANVKIKPSVDKDMSFSQNSYADSAYYSAHTLSQLTDSQISMDLNNTFDEAESIFNDLELMNVPDTRCSSLKRKLSSIGRYSNKKKKY